MLGGSIAIPVSLFWMAWTSRPDISIWSPLAASVLFGHGILCIFITRCVKLCSLRVVNYEINRTFEQLSIYNRLLRNLRRQRARVSYDDPLRRFGRYGDSSHTFLQEHGRTLHIDDHGMSERAVGAVAICVL